jgi:hypothetical protein
VSSPPRKYSAYSPELADRVCELILEGVSPAQIGQLRGMPSKRTIFYWLRDHEDFRQKYELSKMMKAEEWAFEIVEIADNASKDWMITEAGERVLHHEHIRRSEQRINVRKWLMTKWLPAQYADRITADITVRDRRDITEFSNDELLAIASGARGVEQATSAEGVDPEPEAASGRGTQTRH